MKIEYPNKWFNTEEKENTPLRHQRFIDEWEKKTEGFKFTTFENPGPYKGMVIMKDISFSSMCAHHLLPFTGVGHIGYIPNGRLCGASKLIRALEMFASKPQTQEKLTFETIEFLQLQLKPLGVMIVLESQHDCMRIRGVGNSTSTMVTSEVRGLFLKTDDPTKNPKEEFLRLIGK